VISTTFLFITLCTSIQLLGVLRVQSRVHGHGHRLADAAPRCACRAIPRPAPPGTPYRGRTVPRPHAPRPRAPRAWVSRPRHVVPATPYSPVPVYAARGERDRPPIRATNPSSCRRAFPPHLGLRPDALSCCPEPPAGASRGSRGELRVQAGRELHQALLHLH
jgi:hypothetical protein